MQPLCTLTQPLSMHSSWAPARCSHPHQGKQIGSSLDQGVKDLLSPGATLRISGRAAREIYSASPHPHSYAPSVPPFHTVMAQDRDTFLPACRTLLPGWSHAECTRYSSCCPQGASPGNRMWASESTPLQWLLSLPPGPDEFHWCTKPLQPRLFCVCRANLYCK